MRSVGWLCLHGSDASHSAQRRLPANLRLSALNVAVLKPTVKRCGQRSIPMSDQNWLKSNVAYTRKLVHSAAEGAHSGEGAFLNGEPLAPYLNRWAWSALSPALLGAFIGTLAAWSSARRKPIRTVIHGAIGCAIGFGAGFTWKSRRLGASMANGALKEIGHARDERWLETHPIDYA